MNLKCWLGLGAGIAVAVAVAIAFVCCDLDLDAPSEALCPQAEALSAARLLEKAEQTYRGADSHGEECDGLAGVELERARAERHFAVAGIYATASPIPEKNEDGSPKAGQPDPEVVMANSKKAIDEFASGLELNPFDSSASLGLTLELKKGLIGAEQECETAANLVDAGLLGVAGVGLSKGLEQGAQPCEQTVPALRVAMARASEDLRQAKATSDSKEAREAYAKALLSNANLTAAQAGLEATLDDDSCLDEIGDLLDGVPDTLENGLAWLIPLAVGLLLLALAFWVFIRETATRWPRARRFFEGWGRHPGFWFIYNAAVPDLEIKAFDGKGEEDLVGADFSALLAAEVPKQAGREPAFPELLSKGRDPDASTSANVAALLGEIPATKLLGGLLKILSKLFRRRTIRLSGHLVPRANKGAGVLLEIERNGREVNTSTTLWERTFDPQPEEEGAVCWLRLLPAAAVWARWHLAQAQDPTQEVEVSKWYPDALFQSARSWQLEEDLKRAGALYIQALEFDPGLLPAAHNLAVVELHDGKYASARRRLEAIRTDLEEGEQSKTSTTTPKERWPTLDTTLLYTLSLALAYPVILAKETNLGPAIETAQELVETLASTPKPSEPIESPSVAMLASLVVRQEDRAAQSQAIAYAVSDSAIVDEVTRGELRARARELKSWELIHGYLERKLNISRRTHYNLACHFSTLIQYAGGKQREQCGERALASLEAALLGGEFGKWATTDPSLEPLRKEPFEKRFKAVIAAHQIEPKAGEKKDEKAGEQPGPTPEPSPLQERIDAFLKAFESIWGTKPDQ